MRSVQKNTSTIYRVVTTVDYRMRIFNIYIGRESESKRHLFKINLFCTLINTW